MIKIFKRYLSPGVERNPCAMCAEKSMQSPIEMTRVLQEMTSMVRPQKCMKPATFTIVAATQKITMVAPRKLKM